MRRNQNMSDCQLAAASRDPCSMSAQGHERRPFKWRLLDNFRYSPGGDRGRVAAQYVAKGQQQKYRDTWSYLVGLQQEAGTLEGAATLRSQCRIIFRYLQ
jgi:hypothetical protein